MLYILHGSDAQKIKQKYRAMFEVILVKKPELTTVVLKSEDVLQGELSELISAQGLFEKQYIVLIEALLEDAGVGEIILGKAKELESSKNIFVLIENSIDKKILDGFSKVTKRIQEITSEKTIPKDSFNTFALTDALGKRDRGLLWALYHKALFAGQVPDLLLPLLFWQVKSMLLVAQTKSGESTGLKPFVESKTRGFLKNYSLNELKTLSSKLIIVRANARRGVEEFEDFEIGLERFILTL
jgi:DNA polymerase III delta subunit